jgi:hypothetical protein
VSVPFPKRFIASGTPYGVFRSGSERSVRFRIESVTYYAGAVVHIDGHLVEPEVPSEIAIAPDASLPSFSPFIRYTLDLKKREYGNIHDVLSVISADKVNPVLKKASVSAYLKSTSSLPKEAISKCLTRVPKLIENPLQIMNNIHSEKMRSWVMDLTKICFKPDAYFKLLRYFHASFLDLFNDWELKILLSALDNKPYIFCFRNLMARIFCNIPLQEPTRSIPANVFAIEKPSMRNDWTTPTNWYMRANLSKWYCVGRSRERMTSKDSSPSFFAAKYFPLSYSSLARIMKAKNNTQNEYSIEVIGEALEYYLSRERNLVYYGTATEPIPEKAEVALFLEEEKIFRKWFNPLHGRLEMSYPEEDLEELALVKLLDEHVERITLIHCIDCDSSYLSKIHEEISKLQLEEKREDSLCAITVGEDRAKYLTMHTGTTFYGIYDFVDLVNHNNGVAVGIANARPIFFVERANKFSTRMLINILMPVVNIQSENSARRTAASTTTLPKLVLLGDVCEHQGNHTVSGPGTPFADLWNHCHGKWANEGKLRRETWKVKADPYTEQLRAGIALRDLSKLITVTIDDPAQLVIHMNKWMESVKNRRKKERAKTAPIPRSNETSKRDYRCQIFVSDGKDKTTMMNAIAASKNQTYNEHGFHIGDHITVQDQGRTGTVRQAIVVEGGDPKAEQRKNTNYFATDQLIYKILLHGDYEDVEIRTDMHTITHHDVEVVSQYDGTPVNYSIFYVGERTQEIDLLVAAKYTKKSLQIFIPSNLQFLSIYPKNGRQCSTAESLELKHIQQRLFYRTTTALVEKILACGT